MKHLIVMTGIGLATTCAMAKLIQPATLPMYTHLDTEVSTNFPCAFGNRALERYAVAASFLATPSNCVEIAFGKDADKDRVLSPEEADLSLARDCGRWVLRGPCESLVRTAADATEISETSLSFEVAVKGQAPKRCTITMDDDRIELPQADSTAPNDVKELPTWFFNPDWDTVRVTVRGVDGASERIRLETSINSLVIRVR